MNPARCAVVLMLAATLAAVEARAQTPSSSQDSSRRIYLRGCSFLPPQGGGWALSTPGGQGSGRLKFSRLVSKDSKTHQETNIGVIASVNRGVRDRDELLAVVRREMQGPDFPERGARLGSDVRFFAGPRLCAIPLSGFEASPRWPVARWWLPSP